MACWTGDGAGAQAAVQPTLHVPADNNAHLSFGALGVSVHCLCSQLVVSVVS
jgi:hypothetical protein